jgi:Ras-related protein Rab-1A
MPDGKNKPIIIRATGGRVNHETVEPKKDPGHGFPFKFVLLGDSRVGKSSLLLRFADRTYTESHTSTIGVDFKVRYLDIEGKTAKIYVWDSWGQGKDGFYVGQGKYGFHAAIVVFDLTDARSFLNAQEIIKGYDDRGSNKAKILLVGTKADLSGKRVVDIDEITQYVNELDLPYTVNFVETSAKTGENVQAAFELAARSVLDGLKPNESVAQSSKKQDIRQQVIADLTKYTSWVEKHTKTDEEGKERINFSHGFWHHRNSRAANRQANYLLAKDLLLKLQDPDKSIESIFKNIYGQRDEIIKAKGLLHLPDYTKRKINSSALNAVFEKLYNMEIIDKVQENPNNVRKVQKG